MECLVNCRNKRVRGGAGLGATHNNGRSGLAMVFPQDAG